MFSDNGSLTRQVVFKTIISSEMTKGTLVKDYIIHMITLSNEMKILGVKSTMRSRLI